MRAMKDSGIAWIGEIPEGWEYRKFKYSGRFIKGKLPKATNNERIGLPIIGASEMNGKEPTIYSNDDSVPTCVSNDILILWDGANAGLIENNLCGIISSTVVSYSINSDSVHRQYCYYLLKNYQLLYKDRVGGTTIPHMNSSFINDTPLLLPPLAEQQAIADFLDKKCGEIDELVSLQEKMIEELKAYKQSVITEAVTKGLNPDVPMKDSGIEWIGEIPEHWETTKFKALFQIKKIIAGELGYDVLSVTQQGLRVKDLSKNEGQVAQDYSKYQLVDMDDFVMNHMDLLTGYIDCAKVLGVTSPDYRTFVNRNDNVAYNPFYLRIFQKCYKDKTFYHLGQGVSFLGRWRLPKEQLNAFVLPLPSLDEQKVIANYLDTKCTEIDNLISIKLSKIDSLKAYKKSLIYEYVTGKKQVV